MFVRHCSTCRYDCKKDKVCEKYKRIPTNTAGRPPGYTYRGRPIGHALLRGKFEQPYHRKLNPEVPEHNKWIANDYMNLIKKYWQHDTRKNGNLEVLANAILNTHDSLWNSGDPNGKIDDGMPEEERQNIYWKKTLTAYPYCLLDKINEEKRLNNTMITGVSTIEAVNEDSEEDAGIKVARLFTWMEEKLWDIIKTKKVRAPSGNKYRVVQGNTERERKRRFRTTIQAIRLHYIEEKGYAEIAKELGRNKTELNRSVVDMLRVVSEYYKEIFQE